MKRLLLLLLLILFSSCGFSRSVVTLTPQPNACEAFELRRIMSGLAWAVCYDAQARPFGVASGNAKALADVLRDAASLAVIGAGAIYLGDRIGGSLADQTIRVTGP